MRSRHWQMLVVACVVVALSLALRVLPSGRVALAAAPGHPLPDSCASRSLLGLCCPGCGLTRSFVYLAHGDLAASLAVHRVGWILALALLVQFPYRVAALARPRREILSARWRGLFSGVLLALLLGNWIYDLARPHLP